MAVRIRADNKTIICAAKSQPEQGDKYIDDSLHYVLGAEMRVMSVYGHDSSGADLWEFHAPITMDEKIAKEPTPFGKDMSHGISPQELKNERVAEQMKLLSQNNERMATHDNQA